MLESVLVLVKLTGVLGTGSPLLSSNVALAIIEQVLEIVFAVQLVGLLVKLNAKVGEEDELAPLVKATFPELMVELVLLIAVLAEI